MEQAEEAGLSEGDYLKTCNALKKSFEMINTGDSKETPYDVEFKLEFKCKMGYSVSLDVEKGIRVSGPHPNKIKYSVLVSKPSFMHNIIKEETTTCSVQRFSKKLDVLCNTFMFDTFTITNSFGCIEYDVKKAIEHQKHKYDHYNNLNEDDGDNQYISLNEQYYIIMSIFNDCYEENYSNT